MKLLIVDPGHGGLDFGTSCFGYIEKELNLIVARRVHEILSKDLKDQVDLSREGDFTLKSSNRTKMIRNNYKYCLSIHFNAAAGNGHGIETIHSIYGDKGKLMAESIANSLNKSIVLPIRRVFDREGSRGDYYYMHRDTGSTCTCIVECAFIDNSLDIKELNIERIAQGIAKGFLQFLQEVEPIEKEIETSKYYKIASTHVIEVDPMDLKISIQDKPGNRIDLKDFVTSGYQWYYPSGESYPLGILVSEGKVLSNRQPHDRAAGTLIVYKNGFVDVKPVLDITQEQEVWFAVSGCSILPKIRMREEGFTGPYADVGRSTDRPVIGYNPTKNKIVIAVRPRSSISRGQLTLSNLGCTEGITLDGGKSTILKVDNEFLVSTTRKLYSVITW